MARSRQSDVEWYRVTLQTPILVPPPVAVVVPARHNPAPPAATPPAFSYAEGTSTDGVPLVIDDDKTPIPTG